MYYPCSENKDADQLRGYREADLRLYFRICKKPVFSRRGSYYVRFRWLSGHLLGETSAHSINCMFSFCMSIDAIFVVTHFGFEGGSLVLIAPVLGHC